MSQKAWMSAFTKGSKGIQARLAKIHANNPEFQEFVKKHGFGGNLSKKQSELQKKTSVGTVKPVTEPHPERGNIDREAMIKAAAEKIKNRRQAHANRVAFGGELGGGFALHNIGFRTYREAVERKNRIAPNRELLIKKAAEKIARKNSGGNPPDVRDEIRGYSNSYPEGSNFRRYSEAVEKWKVTDKNDKHYTMQNAKGETVRISRKVWDMKKGGVLHGSKSKRGTFRPTGLYMGEDVPYKDASYTMRRGGWVVKRNGKVASIVLPTEDHAKRFIDSTKMTLGRKLGDMIRKKAKEIARGMGHQSYAVEASDFRSGDRVRQGFGFKSGERVRRGFEKKKDTLNPPGVRIKPDQHQLNVDANKLQNESAANRRRVRSWDSAIMPELKPLTVKPKSKAPFDADPPKKNPGVVVGKNNPNYSRVRHLARLGLKKAMEKSNV